MFGDAISNLIFLKYYCYSLVCHHLCALILYFFKANKQESCFEEKCFKIFLLQKCLMYLKLQYFWFHLIGFSNKAPFSCFLNKNSATFVDFPWWFHVFNFTPWLCSVACLNSLTNYVGLFSGHSKKVSSSDHPINNS